MPVRVHILSRVRADVGSLAERHAETLAGALAAASQRALARSRAEVLHGLGARACVRLHEPTLTWTGVGAAEVGPAARAAIDRAFREALARVAGRSGLWSASAADAFQTSETIGEAFDPARYDPVRRAYIIDSYKGGVAPVAVQSSDPPSLGDYIEVAKLIPGPVDEEIRGEFEALMSEAARTNAVLGLIYRSGSGAQSFDWRVLMTDGSPIPIHLWFKPSSFDRWTFVGPNAKPMFIRQAVNPAPAAGSAEIVIRAADPDEFKTKYLALMRPEMAELIQALPTPIHLTTARFREIMQANLDHAINADLAQMGGRAVLAIRIQLGFARAIIYVGEPDASNLNWRGKAKLTTVVAYERRRKPASHRAKGGEAPEHASIDGVAGGTGLCPPDERPDDHPPDDVEESLDDLPFLGEPGLDELGDTGETLAAIIAGLAAGLNIKACRYAGRFCYQAAVALQDAAGLTQQMSETAIGENAASRSSGGNMGVLDFTPSNSAVIMRVRDLARMVDQVGKFVNRVSELYMGQAFACTIHGPWRGRGDAWALRFREAVVPVLRDAVGRLFVGACRSMLLQLLATSLNEVEKRRNAMPRYGLLFERWIVPMIADMAELEIMRQLLRNRRYIEVATPVITPVASEQEWIAAAGALVVTLTANPFTQSPGDVHALVEDAGVWKVRDKKGRLWSREDLEQALALKGAVAEGADPLVKQMVDTPEAMQRFRTTDSIQTELTKILDEMVANNLEMTIKARDDATFAFSTGQIDEDIPTASIPGGKYSLQGLHKIAHEQIGDAFGGSGLYSAGVDDLFDSEAGAASLKSAAVLTGMVLLCVLVPGGAFIAFVAGAALAGSELSDAYQKKRLYKALIDPDLVLSYAEVEATLFAAWVGFILSLIPEAGTATKALVASGKAVVKGETKALGKAAVKAIATRVAKEIAELAVKDILTALIKEAMMNIIINQIIEQAMAPLVALIQTETSIGHGPPPGPSALPAGDAEEAAFIAMIRSLEAP